jgi:hypothetical protein
MSQAALAHDLGLCERAVRKVLSALVEAGHLVTKRRGKMETNLYHLALKNDDGDRHNCSGHDRHNHAGHPEVTGTDLQSDRHGFVKVTGTAVPPISTKESKEEPKKRESDSRLDLGDEDSWRRRSDTHGDIESRFEEWWAQVPRKVAKPAAGKLFRRIIEKHEATVEQLTAGILRYGAEVAGREQRYIAHPSTWLSQGRWADEPAAPISSTIEQNGTLVSTPAPNRPPPYQRESNTQRLMRKLQEQGGV